MKIVRLHGQNITIEFPDDTPDHVISEVIERDIYGRPPEAPGMPAGGFPADLTADEVGREPISNVPAGTPQLGPEWADILKLSGRAPGFEPGETGYDTEPSHIQAPNEMAASHEILPEQKFGMLKDIFQSYKNVGALIAGGFNRGMGVFAENLDAIAQYIGDKTGMPVGGAFEAAKNFYMENAAYWDEKVVNGTLSEEIIGEFIGGAGPGMAEFMLNVPYAAALGFIEGGWSEAGKAAAHRFILGKILHAANLLKPGIRIPAMAGVGGVEAAAAGAEPRDIAKGAGVMAGFGMMGGPGRVGLRGVKEGAEMTYGDLRGLFKGLESKTSPIEEPRTQPSPSQISERTPPPSEAGLPESRITRPSEIRATPIKGVKEAGTVIPEEVARPEVKVKGPLREVNVAKEGSAELEEAGKLPGAKVKFMITNAEKLELHRYGYTQEFIAKMKPEEAQRILNEPTPHDKLIYEKSVEQDKRRDSDGRLTSLPERGSLEDVLGAATAPSQDMERATQGIVDAFKLGREDLALAIVESSKGYGDGSDYRQLQNLYKQQVGEKKAAPAEPPRKPTKAETPTKEAATVAVKETAGEKTFESKRREAFKRFEQEEAGQAMLNEMSERQVRPKQVNDDFWKNTYPNLPDDIQKRFHVLLKRLTGFEPGSVLSVDRAGNQEVAKSWEHIGRSVGGDLSRDALDLEGTERGYVVLMGSAKKYVQQQPAAELEPPRKPTKAETPTKEAATAAVKETAAVNKQIANLRKTATGLTAKIAEKRDPATAHQPTTQKRARQVASSHADAERLEATQSAMNGLADALEAGTTPEVARLLKTKAVIEDVLFTTSWDRVEPTIRQANFDAIFDLLKGVKGAPALRKELESAMRRSPTKPGGYYVRLTAKEVESASKLISLVKKSGKYESWGPSGRLADELTTAKRITLAGIETEAQFLEAKEYLQGLVKGPSSEQVRADKLRELESGLIGVPIPGFFPTPRPVIDHMLDLAEIEAGHRVLEPSAGKGDIADAIKETQPGAKLSVVEMSGSLTSVLEAKGYEVKGQDFLEHQGSYDRIVMNPPFEKGQDMDHVRYAYKLLEPGGRIVSIMSEGSFSRGDRKATEFREWLETVGGEVEKLEPGSFKGAESFRQTGVAARIVTIEKPGAAAKVEKIAPVTPKVTGERTDVVHTGGRDPATYVVMELDDIQPSHQASKGFAKNPDYPELLQERMYHTDKNEQMKVIDNAGTGYDPRFTISNNPDPINGPPIVTKNGLVLGGNSRVMTIDLIYAAAPYAPDPKTGAATRYRNELLDKAEQFGLDRAAIEKMDKPVLVRRLDLDLDEPGDMKTRIRTYNQTFVGGLSKTAEAVARGAQISQETLEEIGAALDAQDTTIRGLLDTAAGSRIVAMLEKDGVIESAQRAKYINPKTGQISSDGKELIERALLGKIVADPDVLESMTPAAVQMIERSLPSLSRLKVRGEGWDITPDLSQAIAEHTKFKASTFKDLDDYFSQGTMFEQRELSERGYALLRAMENLKPTQFQAQIKDFTRAAAADVRDQKTFLEVETSDQAFTRVFESGEPERIAAGGFDFMAGKAAVETPMVKPDARALITAFRPIPEGQRRAKVVKTIEKMLGVPIRVGKIPRGPGIVGVYKRRAQVIRTKRALDFPVISHEVAHHIQDLFGIPDTAIPISVQGMAYEGAKNVHREGFAEFVRYYVTEPKEAERLAPTFYKEFEKSLIEQPEMQELFVMMRQSFQNFQEASSVARIQSLIRRGGEKVRSVTWNKIYTAVKDEIHPLKVLTDIAREKGGTFTPSTDPYHLAWMLRGWARKAEQYLRWGTFQIDTRPGAKAAKFTGPSLTEILRPIEKEGLSDLLDVYMVAKRVSNDPRLIESYKHLIPEGDFEQAVKDLEPRFEKTANKLHTYADELLTYLVQAGRIEAELANKMRERNLYYTPLYRIMDQDTALSGLSKKAFGNLLNPIKRVSGTAREIYSPTETLLLNTYVVMNIAERNRVGVTLDKLARVEGMGEWIESIPFDVKPIKFDTREALKKLRIQFERAETEWGSNMAGGFGTVIDEIIGHQGSTRKILKLMKDKKFMAEEGLEGIENALEKAGLKPEDLFLLDNVLTTFRPNIKVGPNEAIFYIDGKPKLFQFSPDLHKAIMGMDNESMGLLLKIAAMPAKWLRAGAVRYSPEFALRNPARDQHTAFLQSNYNYIPAYDLIRGLFHIIKKDNLWQQFNVSGAAHASVVSLDRNYLKKNLKELMSEQGIKHLYKHPLEMIQVVTELSEEATRVGEFARALKKEGEDWDGLLKAGHAARDVTLDFQRLGAKTKAMNYVTAFWNAQVEGVDKFVRSHKEHPTRSFVKGFLGITMPSILLWAAQHDDPVFQEIPKWRRIFYWNWVFYPDGKITEATAAEIAAETSKLMSGWKGARLTFKIENKRIIIFSWPKPFEWGLIYGSAPEMALDWIYTNDPDGAKEAAKAIFDGATPGIIPTLPLPIAEWWADKSFFFDRPIVPRSKKDLEPVLQYGAHTSETVKLVAKIMHRIPGVRKLANPAKLENLLRGWTGGGGRLITDQTDRLLKYVGAIDAPADPSMTLQDIPGIRGFFQRWPATNARSIEKFYKIWESKQRKFQSERERKGVRGKGIPGTKLQIVPKSTEYLRYEMVAKQLSMLRMMISNTREADLFTPEEKRNLRRAGIDPNEIELTPERKRNLIDKYTWSMINVARRALGKEFLRSKK